MKSVKFADANKVFAEDQPEYNPLHCHVAAKPGEAVTVTHCWELEEGDLAKILRDNRIYVTQVTFGQPLQPVAVATEFNPPVLKL